MAASSFHRGLLGASVIAASLSSCSLVQSHPACCKFQGDFNATDITLTAHVTPADKEFTFGPQKKAVYVAHARAGTYWRDAPPVLLLHEMPGLSPDTLELADCLAGHGYTVYVPLLFGDINENTDSNSLFFQTLFNLKTDPAWKAAFKVGSRPQILDSIETLATQILHRHRTNHLGVIGLCITGGFPLALAAEMPQVVAPIVSQPASPLAIISPARQRDIGITPAQLAALKTRTARGLQILGFRFEYDHLCPIQRFQTLREDFGTHGFLDRTLYGDRYQHTDGLPHDAHSVLTCCYQPWIQQPNEPASHYAYRQLLGFLAAKLQHPIPQQYQDPQPLMHSEDPPYDNARGRCIKPAIVVHALN